MARQLNAAVIMIIRMIIAIIYNAIAVFQYLVSVCVFHAIANWHTHTYTNAYLNGLAIFITAYAILIVLLVSLFYCFNTGIRQIYMYIHICTYVDTYILYIVVQNRFQKDT